MSIEFYLKKRNIKYCLEFLKNSVSLSNQKCDIRLIFINRHPYEYSREFHYHPYAAKFNRCVGNCNTLNELSNNVCVPNKKEYLNLSLFNMVTGINESKTLTNHISYECKCRFDERKGNSDQWQNNDKCRYEFKKRHVCEKEHIWNLCKCNCGNGKYLADIMDDSTIICDEVIELYKEETNFDENKATCKMQNFYILVKFLIIAIALLIAVIIYCYSIKYGAKQKHLLPFHYTNNQ